MTNNKIQAYAERIIRLLDERDGYTSDVKDVYAEVKSAGFNPKALRKVVAEIRKGTDEAFEAELESYRAALREPGATYRSVAEQTGISKSTLHRLVPKNTNGTDEEAA
jgi:uncharacterized protein (UPF0335 family)